MSGTYNLMRFIEVSEPNEEFRVSSPLHFLPQLQGPHLDLEGSLHQLHARPALLLEMLPALLVLGLSHGAQFMICALSAQLGAANRRPSEDQPERLLDQSLQDRLRHQLTQLGVPLKEPGDVGQVLLPLAGTPVGVAGSPDFAA